MLNALDDEERLLEVAINPYSGYIVGLLVFNHSTRNFRILGVNRIYFKSINDARSSLERIVQCEIKWIKV